MCHPARRFFALSEKPQSKGLLAVVLGIRCRRVGIFLASREDADIGAKAMILREGYIVEDGGGPFKPSFGLSG
jgi:hypothetical protein